MSSGNTLTLKKSFGGQLEDDILNDLRAAAQRRDYPVNTVLIHQGAVEHTLYIIAEGHVVAVQRLDDGEERLLSIMGPGEYFGEMGLLDDRPRMATCTAMTDVTVLEVTEEDFQSVVETSPALAYNVTRHILANMRNMSEMSIMDLEAKNEALSRAYADLKAAQEELVEKERMERELELAAGVQRDLLPSSLPEFDNYQFAAYLAPARQVGGDLYDVFAIDDEHVGVLLADVADKGMHAALYMAVTRTLFFSEGRRTLSPAAVATAVHNDMLAVAANADTFVTAFYGVLHRPTGALTYVRAAQDRPLLIRPGEPVTGLPGDGRFLGMLPDLKLEEVTTQLLPGDRLAIFSDGIPDAENRAGENFGLDRLTRVLEAHSDRSAEDLVNAVVADVTRFTAGNAPFDDLTLLAIEVGEATT